MDDDATWFNHEMKTEERTRPSLKIMRAWQKNHRRWIAERRMAKPDDMLFKELPAATKVVQ